MIIIRNNMLFYKSSALNFLILTFLLVSASSLVRAQDSAQVAEAYFLRGYESQQKGLDSLAMLDYDTAIRFKADNATYHTFKGIVASNIATRHVSFKDSAWAFFSQAVALDSSDGFIYFSRASAAYRFMDFDSAKLDYSRAIKHTKERQPLHGCYLNRGLAQMQSQELDSAMMDFREAAELMPERAEVYRYMALVFQRQGKDEKEMECYQQILNIAPDDPITWHNIAALKNRNGDYKTAIDIFDKLIEEPTPDADMLFLGRAWAYMQIQNFEKAKNDLDTAIQIYPQNPMAYFYLAHWHVAQEDKEKTCIALRKAIELGYTQQHGAAAERLYEQLCN
ncbi:MAG: tetratricopeptide repeat protein [Bernardetiaceae bacterium]|nr:tetratricopeptide repeat protein [Bernardetiaceae bacterium]